MKKNNYIKPNMVVVELKHQPRLLNGSPDPDPDAPKYVLDEEEVF